VTEDTLVQEEEDLIESDELLVEEVSIDGMCGRANSRSLSVTSVTLGSHELECPRLVAADPFCGFLDGLDVFHAE
jgi:mycofactocin precursor